MKTTTYKKIKKALAANKQFTIIYGGAASGKTYALGQLVKDILNKVKTTTFDIISLYNPEDFNNYYLKNNGIKYVVRYDRETGLYRTMIGDNCTHPVSYLVIDNLSDHKETISERFGDGKRAILMFNPLSKKHWIYDMFFNNSPLESEIAHCTYKDNEFASDIVEDIHEKLKDTDERIYKNLVLGEFTD